MAMIQNCPHVGKNGCDNKGGKGFKSVQTLNMHVNARHKNSENSLGALNTGGVKKEPKKETQGETITTLPPVNAAPVKMPAEKSDYDFMSWMDEDDE